MIGGTAYCEACKNIGVIAEAGGPRRIDFMGETAADRDIMLCKGSTSPHIFAALSGESWCDDQAERFGAVASSRTVQGDSPIPGNGAFDEQFRLLNHDAGRPLANVRYRIRAASGGGFTGVTDASGRTQRIVTTGSEQLRIEIDNGE